MKVSKDSRGRTSIKARTLLRGCCHETQTVPPIVGHCIVDTLFALGSSGLLSGLFSWSILWFSKRAYLDRISLSKVRRQQYRFLAPKSLSPLTTSDGSCSIVSRARDQRQSWLMTVSTTVLLLVSRMRRKRRTIAVASKMGKGDKFVFDAQQQASNWVR